MRRASSEGLVSATTTAAVLLLIVGALLGARPELSSRLVPIAVVGVLPLLVFIRHVARGYRRFPNDHAAAEYLERSLPSLRSDLRTALDFAAADPPQDPLAQSMRAAQLVRVERAIHAAKREIPKVVPQRSLRRPLARLALASLALVVGAATSEAFAAGLHSLVFGFPADVVAAIDEDTKPIVSTVDLLVEHPAHTGIYPTRVLGVTGDIRAMAGSTVSLIATALVPATSAILEIEGMETQRIQLQVGPNRGLSGRIQITEAATYRFHVTTEDGETLVDPRERRIVLLPDHPPSVELAEPATDLEVTPDQVVDFQYVARDDFGVAEISLAWHFAGDPDGVRFEPLQTGLSTPIFEEHVPFDLAPMRLQPRDEVVVYIHAADNNGFDGPGLGASRSVTLRVGSPDDRNFEVLRLKEALFEGLLRQLGSSLVVGMTTTEVSDDRELFQRPATAEEVERGSAISSARDVHERWLPTVEMFEQLLGLMREDDLTMTGDLAMLEGAYTSLYDRVLDQGRQLDKAATHVASDSVPERVFAEAAMAFADTTGVTERTTLLLEDLVATHKADNVERAMVELEETRQELRTLIEAYRDAPTDELREEIMQELGRLQSRMRELMEQLASQIQDLPTEHLNADAIDPSELAENLSEMTSAMEQLEQMLQNNDIEGALDYLDQLEAELDAVSQELSPLGDSRPDTLSEFDQQMGEMMDELNNLAALEGDLEAETQALLDEMLAERAQQIEAESSAALEEVLRRIERELAEFRELSKGRLSEDTQRVMGDVESGLERLRDRLEQRDPSAADGAATRLLSQLSDARWELRRDESLLVRDEVGQRDAERAQRVSRGTEDVVRDVRDEMRKLMELAQPQPTGEQQQAMQSLGEEQGAIQQRLGALSERVSQMGQRFPALEGQLEPTLEQASQSMERARQELGGARPRPALQGEASALEAMQQMREQMRQMTQQQRQRDQRNGRRNPDEDVEIPEDASSTRDGFRRHVIESMREDSLEDYRDEIRRYYESLLE